MMLCSLLTLRLFIVQYIEIGTSADSDVHCYVIIRNAHDIIFLSYDGNQNCSTGDLVEHTGTFLP
jgi:hypothetical protein